MLRYPVVERSPGGGRDSVLLRTMDPSLLSNFLGRRLVIEVDWVEGCEPAALALAGLERTARAYCPAGKEIVVRADDVIPRAEWASCPAGDTSPLANRHLDELPDEAEGTEVLYMLYLPRKAPDDLRSFGARGGWEIARGGRTVPVRGMVLYKEAIREHSHLWATAARMDRSTLVHEFGHLLGLVGNPAHMQSRLPGHCANPECVMAQPQWRSILYFTTAGLMGTRMPRDYCRECRADIRRAQQLWQERAAADPRFAATQRVPAPPI
jgi:hypothetical protein